jgi:hypothetical protein
LASLEVKPGHPYARSVDLDRFCDFSKPGIYKVILMYRNDWIAERNKGDWTKWSCAIRHGGQTHVSNLTESKIPGKTGLHSVTPKVGSPPI